MKNLSPNPIGMITSLFKKGLTENPYLIENDKSILEFKILSPNPIGVINRRNGCKSTFLVRQRSGFFTHVLPQVFYQKP
ncbi:hypothetical protein [Methanosarcina sp.]|uniref:hypothetical protein n=1 Tax=Methanosarcina sp. TaxID=2213 RepID=UPI002988DD1B|nr:hypothetical protein [Methanosarcina sp.]MDW5551171.1 hypothetical protein [Methanosarcina sp.]MDW5552798.1 hypothetical protein [Methanosarcina sp.]MDW5558187.1 hypothetical protein [Methanosarcina sp.]